MDILTTDSQACGCGKGKSRMDKAPELFTMEQVAARMHKTRRWLQDYLRDRPYYRLAGRTKLFTEQDVARLIEDLPKCHPGAPVWRSERTPQPAPYALPGEGQGSKALREALEKRAREQAGKIKA